MDATNQQKIIAAGFKIIRPEAHVQGQLRIKSKGPGGHEWKTLEKGFESKAALERRMKELLKDPMIVQD